MRLRVMAAALLVSSLAYGQAQEGVAQARFNKGRDLYIKEQFVPALVEFRAASQLYESPNTRLYIARCERALGHMAAAYVEFGRAANEAADRARTDPRYQSTRDAAKQEGGALESKLAHVTLVTPDGLPDGATITINGASLGLASVGVGAPIDPGPVDVVASAAGYVTVHKTARAAAGEGLEIKLQLVKDASVQTATSTPSDTTTATVTTTTTSTSANENTNERPRDEAPRASHGLRDAGFVLGGLGIAGMGVCATFFALAQTRFDQLKSQCGGACGASYNSQINEGQTFQTVGNVALAAGGAAIVTGAIMIIAGVSTRSPSAVQATITPLVGGGWLAGVGRAF
jgi:hypothetical protein